MQNARTLMRIMHSGRERAHTRVRDGLRQYFGKPKSFNDIGGLGARARALITLWVPFWGGGGCGALGDVFRFNDQSTIRLN